MAKSRKKPISEAEVLDAIRLIAHARADLCAALHLFSGKMSVRPIDRLSSLVNTMQYQVEQELFRRLPGRDWTRVIQEVCRDEMRHREFRESWREGRPPATGTWW